MKTTVNSTVKRQRNSSRNACQIRPLYESETSHGPFAIRVYLDNVMDANGKCDRIKLQKLFNS